MVGRVDTTNFIATLSYEMGYNTAKAWTLLLVTMHSLVLKLIRASAHMF
jgi:hypothetical protein